jgi:hypothetical protein
MTRKIVMSYCKAPAGAASGREPCVVRRAFAARGRSYGRLPLAAMQSFRVFPCASVAMTIRQFQVEGVLASVGKERRAKFPATLQFLSPTSICVTQRRQVAARKSPSCPAVHPGSLCLSISNAEWHGPCLGYYQRYPGGWQVHRRRIGSHGGPGSPPSFRALYAVVGRPDTLE